MVILSWIAPIVAHFYTSLDMLKKFLTDRGMYSTSVSFTVSPPCTLMFTRPFISHFILLPLPTDTLILHFLTSVMSFLLYVMYDDALLFPNHYLWYSSLESSWTSTQKVDPTKRLLTSLPFYLPLFAQQSTALCPIFPQLLHSPLNSGFLFLLLFLL